MVILTVRTDKPDAEIGLYDGNQQLAYVSWLAHRELSDTIHVKVKDLLTSQHKDFPDIEGIVAYLGPGSFTGLRIGLSVANALAAGLGKPIVGSHGDEWLETGLNRLLNGEDDAVALPEYGAPVHITAQKH